MDSGITFITGRLSRDPQFFGEGDKQRAVFTVAYNRGRGENKKATFVDCIAWGRMAGILQGLEKGSGVSLHGDLEMDSWEKDGQKRTRLQVVVRNITATAAFADSGATRDSDDDEVTIGSDDDSAKIPF